MNHLYRTAGPMQPTGPGNHSSITVTGAYIYTHSDAFLRRARRHAFSLLPAPRSGYDACMCRRRCCHGWHAQVSIYPIYLSLLASQRVSMCARSMPRGRCWLRIGRQCIVALRFRDETDPLLQPELASFVQNLELL